MNKVVFVFRGGMPQKALAGGPQDFLYGYDPELYSHIVAPRESRQGIRRLTALVEIPFTIMTKLGLPIDIYPLFKKEIDGASTLVAVNDAIGLGLLFWKKLGLLRPRVIVLAQSVAERAAGFKANRPVFNFVKWLLQGADQIWALSDVAKTEIQDIFQINKERVQIFYFGVDTNFWTTEKNQRDNYILAVGNDVNRDYETLADAIPADKKLIIVSRLKIKRKENIEVKQNISDNELRQLYRKAAVVIVPSKKTNVESSGLSVTLQAMACGAPVIVSSSPALTDYFQGKNDGCLTYEPENSTELQQRISEVYANKQMREKLSRGAKKTAARFTVTYMRKQLTKLIT